MKKCVLLAMIMVTVMMTACSNGADEVNDVKQMEPTEVKLTFGSYDMTAITRTATSIAGIVTRLDVWISDGENVQTINQVSTDDGFGSISLTLNKTKTYTLYAMGHKSSGAATLTNGVILFPEDKIKECMFYKTTFSPATTTSLSCLMQRIVGKFTIETTDPIPDEVTKVVITSSNVPTRYGVDGSLSNLTNRENTFNSFTRSQDGTAAFSAHILSTSDAPTNYTITVTAYDADNQVVKSHTFENVPICNGYRTQYRGYFFTDAPFSSTMTVNDWTNYDVVEF